MFSLSVLAGGSEASFTWAEGSGDLVLRADSSFERRMTGARGRIGAGRGGALGIGNSLCTIFKSVSRDLWSVCRACCTHVV